MLVTSFFVVAFLYSSIAGLSNANLTFPAPSMFLFVVSLRIKIFQHYIDSSIILGLAAKSLELPFNKTVQRGGVLLSVIQESISKGRSIPES